MGPDGMLFVRTAGGEALMGAIHLAAAGLIAAVLLVQPASGQRSLDIVLYSDGSARVSDTIGTDPLEPEARAPVLGGSADNLAAFGDDGFLLSVERDGDEAAVSSFGYSSATVEYDTHGLVSKEGRVWTFLLDSDVPYSLLMPPGSIIVGMSDVPVGIDLRDERTLLRLGAGASEVNYILGAAPAAPPEQAAPGTGYLAAGAAAAVAAAAALWIRARRAAPRAEVEVPAAGQAAAQAAAPEDRGIREDDARILGYIRENGGQALESELRKKFLLPRTTMWRAVRRLERQGVIEVSKQDKQNLVRIREGPA
ncbi:Sugar-specific transcriptional regulator TrmB family [Nitrosopumilaceae archaeon]|nr:Sugar-specific transcriptional regulator TrmB family [Nitrosopumilaceae archaeon]